MKNTSSELTQTTLLFLLQDSRILLAMKKRGFGQGKWNGVGGKVDVGESIEDAAVRETAEEIAVTPIDLKKVATLFFNFATEDSKLGKGEETTVFFCTRWTGEPKETEEMKPQWYEKDHLPFEEMWDDDTYWVPLVLAGKKIRGEFWFDENFKLIRHIITER